VSVSILVAAILVSVTTLLLSAFGAWSYRRERNRLNLSLRRSVAVEADQLSVSLALPTWNIDRDQIDKVIEGLDGIPEIEAVVVHAAGRSHSMARDAKWHLRPVRGRPTLHGAIKESRPITFAGDQIAELHVLGTDRFVERQLRTSLLSMIGTIIIVGILLTLATYIVFWRVVLSPLLEIERYAVAVSGGRAENVDAPSGLRFTSELESVRSSIANMVALLRARFAQLQIEVAGRTESEERFRKIFDVVNDAIIISDVHTGQVVNVNAAMCRMYGYTFEEATHLNVGSLSSGLGSSTAEEAMRRITAAAMGEHQLFEWQSRHKDGHFFWTEVNLQVETIGGERRSIVVVRDITQRKELELELKEQKEFTETALNAMTGLFFVQDRQGHNVRWNKAMASLYPHPEDQIPASAQLTLIHPDDRAHVREKIREVFDAGYAETESRVISDGEERVFILNGTRMEIGGEEFLVGTGTEITQRKRAEAERQRLQKELEHSAAEWEQTFDTVHTPILITDRSGVIVRANRAAQELGDPPLTSIIGRTVDTISPGEPWQTARQLISYIVEEGTGTSAETKDESGRTWDLSIQRFSGPDLDAERFILVLWEITGIVELQESLRRSETLSAMGTVVAGVAHEVRNPLFGISAMLDAYDKELGRPEYVECRDALRREVNRLIYLMKELLEYGKPAAISIERGSLNEVIEDAVMSRASSAGKAGVMLRWQPNLEIPDVWLDRSRLRQVFENLIDNAVHHSEADGSVHIRQNIVEQAGRRWVECTVEDEGHGFNEPDLDRVFEPFFTKREGGTGLGLSIVQRIVEEHSGKISAGNRPEGGGIITLLLPLGDVASAAKVS
jgi:PAS domain S-box-containing protein